MFLELVWLLAACEGDAAKTDSAPIDDSSPTDSNPDDSDPSDSDPNDSGPTDSGPTDSGPDDSGPDDSGPDDSGTGPDPCLSTVAVFTPTGGSAQDVTAELLAGTYLTLDTPGVLAVCPGTWFARVLIRSDIEVVGLGSTPADTVLSGGESGTILDVAGPDGVLSVSNVTLDRGLGLSKEHNSGGGGIYCEAYGAATATDVVFTNHSANDGSAVYVEDCELTLTRAELLDNYAEDDGGAVTVWYSNATITDSYFGQNEGLDGGAFALFYGSATVSGTVFEGNTAGNFAGGVWIYNSSLVMSDTSFNNNINTGGDGGGMLLYGTGTLTNVSFADNSAPKGGGLFVYYEAEITGDTCDFSGNLAEDIYAADYSDAGGVSYTAGAGYSFVCDDNVCTGG